MADKTRTEEVEENIETIEELNGPEAYNKLQTQCLKDISISLAMLVDAGSGE